MESGKKMYSELSKETKEFFDFTDAANVNLSKMDAFPNVWEIPFPQ